VSLLDWIAFGLAVLATFDVLLIVALVRAIDAREARRERLRETPSFPYSAALGIPADRRDDESRRAA
jgi:hypothetical protein